MKQMTNKKNITYNVKKEKVIERAKKDFEELERKIAPFIKKEEDTHFSSKEKWTLDTHLY